jgi:hypothetical protein
MKHVLPLLILATAGLLVGCATAPPKTCQFNSVDPANGVEKDDVQCVMNASVEPKARRCYEDILTADDSLEFRVVQNFQIAQSGQAENVSYDLDFDTSPFGVCMTRALKEAKFPTHTSEKPVKITYPWVFRRSHGNI